MSNLFNLQTDFRKRETEIAIGNLSKSCVIWEVRTKGIINRTISASCIMENSENRNTREKLR